MYFKLFIALFAGQIWTGASENSTIVTYASVDSVPQSLLSDFRLANSACQNGRIVMKSYQESKVLSSDMRDPNRPGLSKECQLLPSVRPFNTEINKCRTNKGECVEWADGRFYMVTGIHPNILVDAGRWGEAALQDPKWQVTNKPSPRSIMVIPGNTNTGDLITGSAGHVAVVEGVLPSGHICTSNWNAPYRMRLSIRAVKPHPAMKFIKYNYQRVAKN